LAPKLPPGRLSVLGNQASVNLDGVFLGTKYAIEAMKPGGGGSIVNIASIEGIVGDRRLAAYDATKGGVRLLTKSAALHCARAAYKIRVNSVCPGFLDTKMVTGFLGAQNDPESARRELEQLHPVGHLGEPLDAAYAVLYLASDEAKFATGTELVVDGGYTAR
jgi:3(or 17)beta-hydroxysteroid dehydrogenase